MKNTQETIAAIATPLGEGGVGIVRISGNGAINCAEKVFSKKVSSFASHTAHLGKVKDSEGKVIDQALCLVMKGPASYTGEDVVEFQCHGGMIAVQKVLRAVLEAGARLATAGEFTYRAYMNGKMDLAQAESVQKLIGAKSEVAFTSAQRHLEGRLSQRVGYFQKELVRLAAILEAWVDFPEEDLEFTSFTEIIERLEGIGKEMANLLASYEEGRRMDLGPKVVLIGSPNAGKSSLMNALLDHNRAIVTAKAGTTRDTIEAPFILGGRSLLLVDTAGLREAECEIERLGIARSEEAIEEADLLLWVVDALEPAIISPVLPKEKVICVANKIDLAEKIELEVDVKVSALKKIGIEDLKRKMDERLSQLFSASKDELVISSHRHYESLVAAEEGMRKVVEGLHLKYSAEFVAADVKDVLHHLGQMIGQNVTEEILTSIFSQFCIGK